MTIKTWPLSFAIAHRGASLRAPENTLSALKKAKELGARSVEFDVALTRDHQPVIFHDEILSRTTNGRGRLSEKTLSQIQSLDAGSWFSSDYRNERVPTLAEWLQTAARLKLALNLEIKCATKKEAIILADTTIDHLQKYWPAHSAALLISSSNGFALSQISERAKSIPLGLIIEEPLTEKKMTEIAKAGWVSIHQPHDLFHPDYIDRLHAHNLRALAYTVNESDRLQALKAMGIDGVFTDNQDLFSFGTAPGESGRGK